MELEPHRYIIYLFSTEVYWELIETAASLAFELDLRHDMSLYTYEQIICKLNPVWISELR